MMNTNNSQEQLDIKTKKELATAYQSLYNSIVDAKLANGMSNGQSWHMALKDVEKILKKHEQENSDTVVMEYLMRLFNTHKKIQSKKSMLANDRNEKLEDVASPGEEQPLLSKEMLKIIVAYKKLLKLINTKQNIDDRVLVKYLPQFISNNNKHNNGFYDWLAHNINQEKCCDNDSLQNFEKLYRQYTLNNSCDNLFQR